MPASEKSSIKKAVIKKLGIIAGSGDVPAKLLQACDQAGQTVFVVGFEGQTDDEIMNGREYMMTRIGAAGQIINTLKAHDIRDLVFIGSVRRPGLMELRPDMRTAQFFAKIGLRALGDDGLLKALRHELEEEGFAIHGVQSFVQDLLAPPGSLGTIKPKKEDWPNIKRGIEASQKLGVLDIGQAVVVQEGIVLGVEGIEGTDELIKRCAPLQRKERGAILVKTSKPQQDRDFDLPTVGTKTVRLCADSGFSGIVIEAGNSLLLDATEMTKLANQSKMFVYGCDLKEFDYAA